MILSRKIRPTRMSTRSNSASPGVPPNTLAELALLRRAGNCVTSHVSHSFRIHPSQGHDATLLRRRRGAVLIKISNATAGSWQLIAGGSR